MVSRVKVSARQTEVLHISHQKNKAVTQKQLLNKDQRNIKLQL